MLKSTNNIIAIKNEQIVRTIEILSEKPIID